MIIGGYLLRFLGTIIIYVYLFVFSLILKKEKPSFKAIFLNKYDRDDPYSNFSSEFSIKIIGFLFIIFILLLIRLFPTFFIKYFE
jgi:hypothetical protein